MATSTVWIMREEYNEHLGGMIRRNPHRPDDRRTAYHDFYPSIGRFMRLSQLKRQVTSGMITRGHQIIHRGPWIEDKEEAYRRGCYQFFYREGVGHDAGCLIELEVEYEL